MTLSSIKQTMIMKELGFERHYRYLFNQLNSTLYQGEILQIHGNNGSGKTTLLRILAGFIEPHEGSILWNNEPILNDLPFYQDQLHYLGHRNAVSLNLTVYENIRLFCAFSKLKADHHQLMAILEQCKLEALANIPCFRLSAGQLKRLSLTRLIIKHALLWVLDEPATALDNKGQYLLIDLIEQHIAKNGMVIIATHQKLNFQTPIKNIVLEGS